MSFEIFTTDRLKLRKLTAADMQHIFRSYSKPEIMALLALQTDAAYEKELDKFQQGYSMYNRSLLTFQLIDPQSNQVLGSAGFHNWSIDHKRAEIGYSLNSDEYKGKGLMSEALPFIIHYGFTVMDLQRIEAMVGPNNQPSLRLMEKNHFTREGLLRKHYFIDEHWEDSVVFSLLREEYDRLLS
jgi:ribosomal-protein-alanine N-acetyltransferase